MKRILALLLVFSMMFTVLVGCSKPAPEPQPQGEQPAEETPKEDEKKADIKVGFVTDIGGIDDASFNQGTWEGIVRYAKENNWQEGVQYTYIQSNEEAEYIPNLSAFGDEGYDLVIAAGFLFLDAMKEVSAQYPNTNFALIDEVCDSPNVASLLFAAEQGSFLVGVAAAEATKTGKVGFIGGMDFPTIREFEAGFIAGVKAANPDVEVVSQYAGDFGNPGIGQQIASTMYSNGVDIIYHAAGGTGNGVINEAKNRVENGEEVWVIGVDRDQYEDGKLADGRSVILTSMLKRVDVAAYNSIVDQVNGTFPGGQVIRFTLADDGVGIPEVNPNLSDDIVAKINEFKQKIVSGEIVVPKTVEEAR